MQRKKSSVRQPLCIVIAGPSGAGKTTFAREFLPREAKVLHFLNADLIAAGLSPLCPPRAGVPAGRLLLSELDRLAQRSVDFALESTLSGLTLAPRLEALRGRGYRIEMIYLRLASASLALKRIAARVKQGGHTVPRADVLRRFVRSAENVSRVYSPLADAVWVFDTSQERSQRQFPASVDKNTSAIERALRRATKRAHEVARMHGTAVYVSNTGKIIALKP